MLVSSINFRSGKSRKLWYGSVLPGSVNSLTDILLFNNIQKMV